MNERTFYGHSELKTHVVQFLQDVMEGRLYVNELSIDRELDFVRAPNGITSHIEPTGEETYTFRIVRPIQ